MNPIDSANNSDYFLKSTRLVWRHWCNNDSDLALALTLWGDPRVTTLIDARGQLTPYPVAERLAIEQQAEREHGVQYWPVFRRDGGEFIGCCGLRPRIEKSQSQQQQYEIGFHICAAYWRQGYAFEAAQTVIAYAFGELNANSLFAGHNPQNLASRRLLEKLGFRYTHDEFYTPTGLNHPSYRLPATEFASGLARQR